MKMNFFNEIHSMYECMYLKCMDVQMMYTFYEDQDHFVKIKIYLVKKSWKCFFFHSKHCKKIVGRVVCHVVKDSWLVKS
jgi:hypothetical protein